MFIRPQNRHDDHIQYEGGSRNPMWSWMGVLLLLGGLWLILALVGCSSSRKEYVVDYSRGNDSTAQGSRERPCQTEGYCRILADRDGVRSYWMVYQ